MSSYQTIEFTDELLADGTVYRRYRDGRQEWRRRAGPYLVEWRDEHGLTGTDEQIGAAIIKRVYAGGKVRYGRDLGYGRTVWRQHPADPTDPPQAARPVLFLTVNRSAFGGRVGALLAEIGARALPGLLIAPPLIMTAVEEARLRRALEERLSRGDGGGGGDSIYAWEDDSPDLADDFG
ncbi:MAG: hypothetical protein IRZ08_13410 [Frankia sp.]|nr:hypothetical protein [Frankia sp.]